MIILLLITHVITSQMKYSQAQKRSEDIAKTE